MEAAFQQIKGINQVISGYAGGTVQEPSYEAVCTGTTGHAEAVQLDYDPALVTYEDLLDIFWTLHDPTTLNRQGNDVGTQYRSVIFYHDQKQKNVALKSMHAAQKLWSDPIITEIKPYIEFFAADDYHQNYYKNNSEQSYCQVIINPKLAMLRQKFAALLK